MERMPMKAKAHQSSGCSSLPSSKLVSVHLADARGDVFFFHQLWVKNQPKKHQNFVNIVFTMKSNNGWSIKRGEIFAVTETICTNFSHKFGFTALTVLPAEAPHVASDMTTLQRLLDTCYSHWYVLYFGASSLSLLAADIVTNLANLKQHGHSLQYHPRHWPCWSICIKFYHDSDSTCFSKESCIFGRNSPKYTVYENPSGQYVVTPACGLSKSLVSSDM